VNEPVLIVRPDDGPIGPKRVTFYVLLLVITDVLDANMNTLFECCKLDYRSCRFLWFKDGFINAA
jgi:hypothetical protein